MERPMLRLPRAIKHNFGGQNKKWRELFWCMKLEELMAEKYSKILGTCSELVGTCVTIKKTKFQSKMSGRKEVQNRSNQQICQCIQNFGEEIRAALHKMVHPVVLCDSSCCDGGHEGYKPTKSSTWYIFSCSSLSMAMNSFLCLSIMVFLIRLLVEKLEVITVRKDNISRLVAEYLIGGFMR
jgi:hypothetical protein